MFEVELRDRDEMRIVHPREQDKIQPKKKKKKKKNKKKKKKTKKKQTNKTTGICCCIAVTVRSRLTTHMVGFKCLTRTTEAQISCTHAVETGPSLRIQRFDMAENIDEQRNLD